jgi:hypothetical protein
MAKDLGAPWMVLLMNRFKALSSDMGIDLGSRDIGMTQKKLYYPQIGAMIE